MSESTTGVLARRVPATKGEAREFLEWEKEALGSIIHPDDRGAEIVDEHMQPLFTPEEAEHYDRIMDAVCDLYDEGDDLYDVIETIDPFMPQEG